MDEIEKKLLDIVQSGFPIDPRPYKSLGDKLGIDELEAFQRLEKLRQAGIIRRLGANFQSAGLGFVSTLCAAKVEKDQLERFVEIVNSYPGVTHNYERVHEYNIWFTLISPSREQERKILEEIEARTGVTILNLPATRLYKIKVDFPME